MAGMSMMGQPARLFKALTTPGMRAQIKHFTKSASNLQRPTHGDNVFLFSTPRSGGSPAAAAPCPSPPTSIPCCKP